MRLSTQAGKPARVLCVRLTVLLLLLLQILLQACSVISQLNPDPAISAIQSENIRSTLHDLDHLAEADTLIKLNNRWLSRQVTSQLSRQAENIDAFNITRLKVNFHNQFIAINANIDVSDKDGNTISTSVNGDIQLTYSYPLLKWSVNFSQLEVNEKEFSFDGGVYAEPVVELEQDILKRIRQVLLQELESAEHNTIAINAVPTGEIQVGAALSGFASTPANHTEPLRGYYVTAGSAVLIAPDYTTIGVDLSFIPGVSQCASEVSVSRAGFARKIESREPVGIASETAQAEDIKYFFSEISGARQATTIIHYWYSNGKPVAVEELNVGVSKRWRTWSSGGSGYQAGDRLNVLVVEKQTGCILMSDGLQLPETDASGLLPASFDSAESLPQLHTLFEQKTKDISLAEIKTPVAIASTAKSFISSMVSTSLSDLTLSVSFTPQNLTRINKQAYLNPFDPAGIICERRECPQAAICKANISHCKRLRDTRDCTSCLFRNPLNNRCVKESTDPLCEASRDRQNARFDAERNRCISEGEAAQQECEQSSRQAVRSCEIEAGFAGSACDAVKSSLKTLPAQTPLARVDASAIPNGSLSVDYSNFRVDGALDRLKLDITLNARLTLNGNLDFSPASIAKPLASCIKDWGKPFTSRISNTPSVSNLQSAIEQKENELLAEWSGFGLGVNTRPSPVESVLTTNPQLLANCRIGLTVANVQSELGGEDAGFFKGSFDLEVQPLPTIIRFYPASISDASGIINADGQLSDSRMDYYFVD